VDCLDEDALLDFFEQRMDATERASVDRHIDACPACRALVATLAIAQPTPEARDGDDDDPTGLLPRAPEEPPNPYAPGDVLADRYRLDAIVGEGGMGVVWAATHLVTRKAVALKILKVREPEHERRFVREARVAAALGHPNVVDVHDVFQPRADPLVMVMDLLRGESLDRRLAARGRLPLAEARAILVPAIRATLAAHALGVVHRDLKPANVFLEAGPPERVCLLDFGIAKLTAASGDAAVTGALTRSGAIIGTPHYMAPEQLYGESAIDARADVWAIGVIAYECLTGQRPIDGKSFGQVFRNVSRRAIVPIAQRMPELPARVAAAIDGMLAHDRDQRLPLENVLLVFGPDP